MIRLYYIHRCKDFLRTHSFRGKGYIHRVLNYLLPNIRDNIVLKTKYGFKLRIHPLYDKGIERNIFYYGSYEKGTLWCFEKIIRKGDIVFDIGANIGLTSLHSSKLVGSDGIVYAFEPNPKTYKLLVENIQLNQVHNINSFEIALSNQIGEGLIYENLDINRGASSLYSDSKINGLKIKLDTLDNFTQNYKIDLINFIKIDVEGSEVPTLLGSMGFLNNNYKPIICIEYSLSVNCQFDPILIYSILKEKLNYKLFKQLRGKESFSSLLEIEEKNELPLHDNIYCFQQCHFNLLPEDLFLKTN